MRWWHWRNLLAVLLGLLFWWHEPDAPVWRRVLTSAAVVVLAAGLIALLVVYFIVVRGAVLR